MLKTIDFIGVVHTVGPCEDINLKNGTMKKRRNVAVADDSNLSIIVSLWGHHASNYEYDEHPVL